MFKLSFRSQVLAGFGVSILLVFVVGYLSFSSINQLESDTGKVDHTQKVIRTADNLLQQLIDAETGMRGYAATGKTVFLEPYNAATPEIHNSLDDLRSLIADNPIQVKRVDDLSLLINAQLNVLKADVEAREKNGLAYMVENSMLLAGKHNMDSIRRNILRIKETENQLLDVRKDRSQQTSTNAVILIGVGSAIFLLIIIVLFFYIQKTFAEQKRAEEAIRITNIELEKVLGENEAKNWLLTGTSTLNEKMQGQQSEKELTENILTEIGKYTGALTGTVYLYNDKYNRLELYSTYAFSNFSAIRNTIALGEGWIGEAARSGKATVIKGKLNEKLELQSSMISDGTVESYVLPFFFDKKLKGVMELAYRDEINCSVKDFMTLIGSDIGVAINTAQARTIMHSLYEETQHQAEELAAQQEEMRVTNEELINKTEMLEASEEELRVQQEELRSINTELEEKASLLEEKNQAIEEARAAINLKVEELETTGRYKSEFLANMSHELRTPLNSILVLARILKDNKPANLSEDQVKYASVIFNAGNDLLTLINDILDLSKIESGKLEMQNEDVKIADILADMESLFAEVAANKQIRFTTSNKDVPETIFTDKVRVEQVIKNLLSNAFKFTHSHGAIAIDVEPGKTPQSVSFSVKDTGIGIPADKQKIIFEAFQQADGSTSRKYGGTGLGLSISRELALLLGGSISLSSKQGEGSEFTLTIPLRAKDAAVVVDDTLPIIESFAPAMEVVKPSLPKPVHKFERDPLVVIVEDDENFATILQEYSRDHGYKSVIVNEGTNAVQTIKDHQPDAVILDIMLPGKDGWQILKELKKDPETVGIPVHLMSAGDATAKRVHKEGAVSFMKKPIDTNVLDKLFGDIMVDSGTRFKQILLVEDHEEQSQALKNIMQENGIMVDQAFDGESAFSMLHENDYQCVVLDLNLPDISGLDLLDKIKEDERFQSLPIIVNTAMELDKTSVNRLMQYANAMVVKTNKSSNRLIDEVNLFLNKVSTAGPQHSGLNTAKNGTTGNEGVKGKKVLIVDDDMRNIFALSSALQGFEMTVEIAGDGEEALEKLNEIPSIDIVLMDIMMPKMDGYEATRNIRKQGKWARLPVIALTAKAMRDDREKCIAAGANDYITKPVDMDRLIALMQLWLNK